jgi:hypothetical protein
MDQIRVAPQQQQRLAEIAQSIRARHRRVCAEIFETGRELIEAKSIVGHGTWLGWLRSEFNWNKRTAQDYMLVYERFKDADEEFMSLDLTMRVLAKLASPSTHEAVRDAMIDKAKAKEAITRERIGKAIKEAKAEISPELSTKEPVKKPEVLPPPRPSVSFTFEPDVCHRLKDITPDSQPTPPSIEPESEPERELVTLRREIAEDGFTEHCSILVINNFLSRRFCPPTRAGRKASKCDAEIETAIIALGQEPGGGLVVVSDGFMGLHRASIILAATRNNIPAVFWMSDFAREGGLLSYGPDVVDQWRRAATYVDRILRGAKPGDLPVQFPTKFEMVVNLKTAKALGLAIPPSILLRADEVIE